MAALSPPPHCSPSHPLIQAMILLTLLKKPDTLATGFYDCLVEATAMLCVLQILCGCLKSYTEHLN